MLVKIPNFNINMKNTLILFLCMCLLGACSQGRESLNTAGNSPMSPSELIMIARESADRALNAKKDSEQENWALHGISVAEQCMMRAPEEPWCYYYRAINTGLYHEVKIIGYQTGIKRMIEDCENVIKFDPKYDHGGAYRILGQLYTKLPQTVGRPDSITRDLDKAEQYLKQALKIDPEYPENQIFLAETLLAKGSLGEALSALTQAKGLTRLWSKQKEYSSWQSAMNDLEIKIKKASEE